MDIPRNMHTYYLALLYKGGQFLEPGTPPQRALQIEHLAYNREMAEKGVYRAFGPLRDEAEILAVSVLQTGSLAEAQAAAGGDPAVKAGHFRVEVHPLFWPSLDGMKVEYEPRVTE